MRVYVQGETEVSVLLYHNAYPLNGNFIVALHIMYYLKGKKNLAWLLT